MIVSFSYDLPNFFATGGNFVLYTAAAWTLKSVSITSFAASPVEILNDGTSLFGGDPFMPVLQVKRFNAPFTNYVIFCGVQASFPNPPGIPPPPGSVPFVDNQTHILASFPNVNVECQGDLTINYNPASYNNTFFNFAGQIEVD